MVIFHSYVSLPEGNEPGHFSFSDPWLYQPPKNGAITGPGTSPWKHTRRRVPQPWAVWQALEVQASKFTGNSRIQLMEVLYCTIFLAIFCGDIPWKIGLNNRPKIYGWYLQFRILERPLISRASHTCDAPRAQGLVLHRMSPACSAVVVVVVWSASCNHLTTHFFSHSFRRQPKIVK